MNKIEIYFDGSCNNKLHDPFMCVGIAVLFDGKIQHNLSKSIKFTPHYLGIKNTNNIAEWIACLEALSSFLDVKLKYPNLEIKIFSDSQIVAETFNGKFKTTNILFSQLLKSGKEMIKGYDVKITWIPRPLNSNADYLSKLNNPDLKINKKK